MTKWNENALDIFANCTKKKKHLQTNRLSMYFFDEPKKKSQHLAPPKKFLAT